MTASAETPLEKAITKLEQDIAYDIEHPPGSIAQLEADIKQIEKDIATIEHDLPCFVAGTRLATADGPVAVENLVVGQQIVTADGSVRSIEWLGHRTIDLRNHPRAVEQAPVRIARDAFGPGKPERDLLVSPGHAICVNLMSEILVPAVALINGATITREMPATVTYWHVELATHDILLSENLPTESYIDVGNKAWFTSGEGELDPDRRAIALQNYCRPFVDSGKLVDAVREQLTTRANALGWRLTREMDVHLLVDGRRVEGTQLKDRFCFLLDAGARDVRLMSATFVPAWEKGADQRRLGLCLSGLQVQDGFAVHSKFTVDDAAIDNECHREESGHDLPFRWTRGEFRIAPRLLAGCVGPVLLTFDCLLAGCFRWWAPLDGEVAGNQEKVVRLKVA